MIQRATESDVEKILVHSAESLYEGTMKTSKFSQEKVLEITTPLLEKGAYYLVVKQDNILKGWILIGSNKDYFSGEEIGFIYELYVLHPYRGQGFSRQLMRTAVDELDKLGYSEIRLNVFAGNFAKELYKEMGFVERQVVMSLRRESK
ncbi:MULTISPECIES: GNAT family N-acetyltransferase [unclassified Bacillus (in: firmicutes)]|uniref:GNAT family N-acetyltransferase n=1 Tax=unclassified Bacillus (in: firmicutes) TaxID=185979 RepID=UPI0008ED770D|nr:MULTISPECIES: GNAT family N-acetyltransferase [unclassified Bacillus (in: firmicutes)]SFI03818.1 Acetyltransferase (GNAT) domain-containing protein [Bacillus sp. 71mf]SFS80692.1 Acetyltransferase (GNAT) domain-containing protein [Bacillus sp. 103mf]